MTNLVFLEAATQSEGAATIIESNEALINFATAEVDSLVEEQALHTSWHVGSFVEESFDITYENMTDPISDIVVEATSIFADVIASDVSDSEKKELIEGYAHIIAMGDGELISEITIPIPLNATGAAGVAGGAAGGVAGGAAGAVIGKGAVMLFSKKRKIWKKLVDQEKQLRESKASISKINKVVDEKKKAKKAYDRAKLNGSVNGMLAGSFIGAAGGMAAGLHYGRHL